MCFMHARFNLPEQYESCNNHKTLLYYQNFYFFLESNKFANFDSTPVAKNTPIVYGNGFP